MTDHLVSTSRQDGWVVVSVVGEIDLSNVEHLRRDIDREIDGLPMAVDLSGVSYIDSQGLHLLHQIAMAAADGRQELVFVAREESVAAELLRITNMTDVLPVYTERPAARDN